MGRALAKPITLPRDVDVNPDDATTSWISLRSTHPAGYPPTQLTGLAFSRAAAGFLHGHLATFADQSRDGHTSWSLWSGTALTHKC
jgi:hypothetical protein